jgi:hypothetical protein
VTVADESGWEFETVNRLYANVGLDKRGQSTGVAWRIVKTSPDSTALRAEEVRAEKMTFAVEPRDGRRFTIRARMRYFFAPPPEGGIEDGAAAKMAETTLTLPGKRPS